MDDNPYQSPEPTSRRGSTLQWVFIKAAQRSGWLVLAAILLLLFAISACDMVTVFNLPK